LFLVAIVFKLAILINPAMPYVTADSQFVWVKVAHFLENMLGHSPFLLSFFAIINIAGQGIYLNRIVNRHHLFPKATYLPALGYVLVTSLFKEWNYVSAALICNWLLLAMFSGMLQLYATQEARKQVFNIGCFIALASLLVFPNIAFIVLLLIALGILRPFSAAEWTVGLLGILTPFYFLAGILFLTGDLPVLKQMISVGFSLPKQIEHPETALAAFSMLMILIVTGIYYLNGFMSRMLMQTKKLWGVSVAWFLISIAAGIFTVAQGYNQWLGVLLPATLFFTNIWFEDRKKWIMRILFYLFVTVVIFVQWYPA
jgi:hypothetical protein